MKDAAKAISAQVRPGANSQLRLILRGAVHGKIVVFVGTLIEQVIAIRAFLLKRNAPGNREIAVKHPALVVFPA
jgi:hypothetical protein